jgi:cell wall-associated NlpC family hydrolase
MKGGEYLNPIYFADTGTYNPVATYSYAGEPMGDDSFTTLMAVARQFAGFPYVWGGSSPETSFDCSGLVSYCLRASGVADVGRLTAQGLYNLCTPVSTSEAKPGDLVFYHSTYSSATPISHVGIYCGDNLMFDAGDPIGYTSINTAYWQSHFYAFARLT